MVSGGGPVAGGRVGAASGSRASTGSSHGDEASSCGSAGARAQCLAAGWWLVGGGRRRSGQRLVWPGYGEAREEDKRRDGEK
jgi:hypothetical protein